MASVQSLLAILKERRALVVVTAVVVVVAVVTALLINGAADESDSRSVTATDDVASQAPEGEHEGEHDEAEHQGEGDHEHDHVDTVDPDIDPAEYTELCTEFYVFADAYSSAMETLNESGEAPDFLVAAADGLRRVAAATELEDEVRAGLAWFIDDVLRVPNDASTEEQLAWSTFLNSACPA